MASFNIIQPNRVGRARARVVVQSLADYYRSPNLYPSLTATWKGDTIHFSMENVRGSIAVSDRDVQMKMELSGLAMLAASSIEQTAREYFNQYL